ncbi:MAG: hypothetical protein HY782_17320 [Chloroflexi bacterium]|nr:hypothetical protein [Chloroflexota bacterium]
MFHTRFVHLGELRQWGVLPIVALILAISACSSPQPAAAPPTGPIAGDWVGKVEGTDAFIGIASNGKEVMAYVCDGKAITQWFHGTAGVDKVDLVAGTFNLSAGPAILQGQLARDAATGAVTLANGQSFKYQASRAAGDAGLYRLEETVNNQKRLGGWVILNDGQLRGITANLNTGALQTQISLSNVAIKIGPSLDQY